MGILRSFKGLLRGHRGRRSSLDIETAVRWHKHAESNQAIGTALCAEPAPKIKLTQMH
ncbi:MULTISPECIES: hypothetical protein [unclassified Novosphingobium]|uniref:hypothetical protein n=1 Tax=unclassified Novosphingobium TaxID=2644732 RepID=UPI000BE7786B|nr:MULTISPECIES: hypothetical protein [unclassified Novosphingobium]BBA73853.1 hypothetical protein [Novosphingobium sp. PY1]GFM31090.1 uncharacterized protein PY1_contig_16_31 [Novosphingobium sp. PY1]